MTTINILITGGAGYVGSILTEHLLTAGHRVTVLDSFMYDQASLNHLCSNPNLTVIRGDCRDLTPLHALIAKADVVIPLAAIVGAKACDRNQTAARTVIQGGMSAICNALSPEQLLIVPTTNSGYGIGQPGVECTEESPLKPVSLYGKLKVEAEDIAMSRENSVSLRLATVFGMSPRMRMDLLVNDLVWRAVADRSVMIFEGHFKRNYVHVRDVALAFIHVLNGLNGHSFAGRPVFNVGLSSANLSKLELCARIKEQLPAFTYVEAEIGEDPDKRDYVVSNAKIEATGWVPRYSLDDGIRELIKGYVGLQLRRYVNA